MTVCKESCIFQSCASSPNNAKSREAQAPTKPEVRIMVKRKLTVGGLICHLASVMRFHWWWKEKRYKASEHFIHFFLLKMLYPTCNFFLEYDPRFSVAPFQLWPERAPKNESRCTFTFLTKRVNAVLSFRTTRVRVPLARNPSPLQHPTLYVHVYSVRSLLRQPRSALEAGPSEAHAISFVHTSRPRLHRKGCTFSVFRPYQRNNGQSLIGLKRHPFSGPMDSVGELLHTP